LKKLSFNFEKGMIDRFNDLVPDTSRSRTIRNYLLKEYQLPTDIKELPLHLEGENEIYPFHFNPGSIKRLEEIVQEAQRMGININKSIILRDVINKLIQRYTLNSFTPRIMKRNTFKVELGTVKELDKYIPKKERSFFIEDFILEEYEGPRVSGEVLRIRPVYNEDLKVSMDICAFEKLEHYVNRMNTKGVTKAAIFRDAVNSLLTQLKSDQE